MKFSFSFKCALVSAGIFIAIKLATFFTHTQLIGVGTYANLIALGLTSIPLYIGIKQKRDKELGGYITLRQSFLAGVAISLQASLFAAIYTYLHNSFIDTEVIAYWTQEAKRVGAEMHKSETEIQSFIDFYSPFHQAIAALMGILGAGALLSFIISTILVRKADDIES